MRVAWLAALTGFLLGWVPAALADEVGDLGGFEDDEEFEDDVTIERGEPSTADRWWDIDGSVNVSSSIAYLSHQANNPPLFTDWTGVTRLRARLNLQLDFELPRDFEIRLSPYIWYDFSYLINGRDNFTDPVLDEYEWEWDFQDSYIEGPLLENLDVKIGRQVVNWGRSDSLRVLDVLNPLDNREPGRADIEDLRWAVTMAKVDWNLGPSWTLTGIAIPELRFDTLPAFGNDFDPFPAPIPTREPDHWWKHWEFAGSLRGIFEAWDFSVHYAYIFTNVPRASLAGGSLALVYDRLHMVGAGANYTFGAWLVKGEIAAFEGLKYLGDELGGNPDKTHWGIDSMLGLEYYGFSEATVALEIANRNVIGHDDALFAFERVRLNSGEYAIRYTGEWLNDRLTTTVLALLFGWKVQDGVVLRAQADYTIRDGLVATVGMVIYQAGDVPPLSTWGRNDRVFIDVKWSF